MSDNTAALVRALRTQRQIDEDGCEVGVSRQACDEAAAEIERLERELVDVRDERARGTAALRTALGDELWRMGHPAYVVAHLREEFAKALLLWKSACVERDASRAEIERLERERADVLYAGELLAVMHGDGGHYAAQHGWRKAVDDAITKRNEALLALDAARAEAEALRKDAERYRWLRSDPMRDGTAIVSVQLMDFNEDGPTDAYYAHAMDSLDAAIDAMREGGT